MVLSFIFTFLSFLASPFGMLATVSGLVAFLLLPFFSKLPGEGRRGAHFMLWLSQTAAGRAAVVVSEAGEVFHKTLQYDDTGVFTASFSDGEKHFGDPADAMSRFMGGSFCLADEKHGVLFDPRYAAVGKRKFEAKDKEEMFFRATDDENSTYSVRGWVRGVFELPSEYELVDLTAMRSLVSGGERAEYGPKVQELYKFSREPYRSSRPLLRLLLPVVGFLATFGGLWVVADQASAPSSSVSFGFLWLLLAVPSLDEVRDKVDWRRLAKVSLVVLSPVAIIGTLYWLTNAVFTALVLGAFLLGFVILPAFTLLSTVSSKLSGGLARLWLKLGLLGYDRPVFVWTKNGYQLREYVELEDVGSVKWYDLAGTTTGFTFIPTVDSFEEGWTAEDVTTNSEVVTDGGEDTRGGTKTNLPPGYTRCERLRRADYGGFVPTSPDSRHIYVKAGRFMRRLAPAATGRKSKRNLEYAREKYGLGWAAQMSDKTIAYMTFVLVLVAAALGVWLFFL